MNWGELGLWFITAFVGAGIVKLFDLAYSRYNARQIRREKKISVLMDHIKDFGQLTELYRFFASYSAIKMTDEKGQLKRDNSGNYIVEKRVLEPAPRFEGAIKNLQGTDINSAIALKIASIRLSSSEAMDMANELDPSGDLKQQFTYLYTATIWSMDNILADKSVDNADAKFVEFMSALKAADDTRRKLRARVQKLIK
jgi:hypothetical protein